MKEKAEMLTDYEDRLNIFDTLTLCRFYRDIYTWEALEESIHLATGLPADKITLKKIAASILDMTKRYNIREGLTSAEDRWPKRLHKEILADGNELTEEEMEYMLMDYYRLRGWNSDGVPASLT